MTDNQDSCQATFSTSLIDLQRCASFWRYKPEPETHSVSAPARVNHESESSRRWIISNSVTCVSGIMLRHQAWLMTQSQLIVGRDKPRIQAPDW